MKTIAITRIDGGVSIMFARDDADIEIEMDKWKSSSPGQYVAHRETDVLPGDINADPFRNAWTDAGGKIDHDIAKAKEVARDQLRAAREPKLAALDVEFLRAAETQDADKLNAITAKKQALRDITADPSITNAKTVKGLTSALTKLKQSIEA